MQILRSVGAVVAGALVAMILIGMIEAINGFIYPPPEGKSFMEWWKEVSDGTQLAKDWIKGMPASAMALLQVAWGVGACVGGAVAALIAARWRLLHAGLIGAFVLAGTIMNFQQMKEKLDYTHPDWLIITGLLLPLPLSLLGGYVIDRLYPLPPSAPERLT